MGKKVIRLTEADIQKIVRKFLIEQDITQTPDRKVLLGQLEDKIISFLEDNRKNEFLKNIKISIDLKDVVINDDSPDWVRNYGFNKKPVVTITDGDGKKLISTEINYYENKNMRGTRGQKLYFPGHFIKSTNGDRKLTNSGLYIGSFIDEIIGEDKVLKDFYEREPGVKEQVDSLPIKYVLVLSDGSNNSNIQVSVGGEGRWEKFVDGVKRIFTPKKLSNKVTQGNTTTMDKLFYSKENSISRWFDVGDYKIFLGIAPMMMPLDKLNITTAFEELDGGTPPPTGTTVAPQTIELDLVDVFKYDDIDIVNPTEYQTTLNNFEIKLDNAVKNIKGFKDHLNDKTLTVNGYASQDANPEGNVPEDKGYRPCSGQKRKDYNMCLSQKRAEKVAGDLKTIFDKLGLTTEIKGVGKGEITKFKAEDGSVGDGWTDGEKDDEKHLSANRRVTFKVPPFTG